MMTYAQAKLRVWSPEAYTKAQVHEAAIWLLGCLSAHPEDVLQAMAVL